MKLVITLLSLFGSSLVIISTLNFGIGLWPDSIGYIATANNLQQGNGFLSFDAQPVTAWPPLYPFILYLLSFITGSDLYLTALILNSFLFGMIIFIMGVLFSQYIHYKSLIVIGLAQILISIAVFQRALWAGSETLFVFLLAIYIYFLKSYVDKNNILNFIFLSIITAFGVTTRYIGITLIFTTGVAFFILIKKSIKEKLLLFSFYLLFSLIPISIWLIRNFMISKNLFGNSGESRYSFLDNIILTVINVLNWYIPTKLFKDELIFFFVIIMIFFIIYFSVKKIKDRKIQLNIDKKILVILISFILFFLLTQIFISSFKSIDPINNRLLSPVYIPISFLILLFFQSVKDKFSNFRFAKLINRVILLFLVLSLIYPLRNTTLYIDKFLKEGGGYSGIAWNNYQTKKLLKSLLKYSNINPAIYSNDPHAVYFLSKMHSKWSPFKTYYNSNKLHTDLRDLKGTWPPENNAYFVWFLQSGDRDWLYKPEELMKISKFNSVDSSNIGCVYLISRIEN